MRAWAAMIVASRSATTRSAALMVFSAAWSRNPISVSWAERSHIRVAASNRPPAMAIATSHTIANIGDMFNKRTTSGGGGPKFTATFRLDLRATSKIRTGTGMGAEVIGMVCRAVVDKNRIVAPWKEVRLAIPFNQPISRASGLIPLLCDLGICEAKGNFLYHQGQKLGRAYKTKDRFLQQDEQGEAILDQFPELLEDADRAIEDGLVRRVVSSASTEETSAEEASEEE